MKMEITGHTHLAGLYAKPARHSISPMMHNAAFIEKGIDARYLAFDVEPEDLKTSVEAIRTLQLLGVNLSMPHKMAAVPLMDELSEAAQLIGAINTIVHHEGKLIGHNTDGIGFMASLTDAGISIIGKEITLMGAGGAATAIISQAALDGVKKIHVFNRKDAFYDQIAVKLAQISRHTNCEIHLADLEDHSALQQAIATSVLLVNATRVGMKPNDGAMALPDVSFLHAELAVYDVIYEPRETKLLRLAREKGLKTVNGLGMLLYQGAASFELWTGQKMPVEKIKPIVENN
ncbi:shikimate dehydrogenase [Enterococcus sp. JM9B]|uniref:shikimate dehydrogenase n=1 Tax=Enterococcus sp. JM9B TaxID=1857216 RepID=UPI00192A347F|nr:shikimate dehydrogenase [Enterococcus sp. JM9B]